MDLNKMATNKTATLTFRIDPEFKEALREAAIREHRSIANMVEILIRDYCSLKGIKLGTEKNTVPTSKDND